MYDDITPELTFQHCWRFVRPGTPEIALWGYSYSSQLTTEKRREYYELEKAFDDDPVSSNIPVALSGEPTQDLPIINPREIKPIAFEVFTSPNRNHAIDEIMVRYGARGFFAAVFDFKFENGQLREIVFDPDGDNERRVSPNTSEFTIRTHELSEILNTCASSPESFHGVDALKTPHPLSGINPPIEPLSVIGSAMELVAGIGRDPMGL